MDKDLKLFYLLKIKKKIRWIIENGEISKNELLMYLEICIEICNMLEKRFYKKVNEEREDFKNIQAAVLYNDYFNALEYTVIKIKELDDSEKTHLVQNKKLKQLIQF